MPLEGHDETTQSKNLGVFLGLIDFACSLDPLLRKHMDSSTAFKKTTKTIQNEILDLIMFVCQDHIKNKISKSDFLAIMTDETMNMQDKSQMVIVLCYEINGKVVERFWGYFNPPNLTAAALSSILLDQLKLLIGDHSDKLVAQTYDGAANLSGSRNGDQTRIKDHYPYAHLMYCYVHKLNFIVQKAYFQNKSVQIFLTTCQGFLLMF